jgi:uncharacterized protein (TIGR02145 family)
VYKKCVDPSVHTTPTAVAANGKTYEPGQICQADGKVQANCGGTPYDPDAEFCQDNKNIKFLCGKTTLQQAAAPGVTIEKGATYTATQFCQDASGEYDLSTGVDAAAIATSATLANTGTVKSFCTVANVAPATGNSPKAYGKSQFCQAGSPAKIQFLCDGTAVADRKEYPAAQFCQAQSGSDAVAPSAALAAAGKIRDYCTLAGSSTPSAYSPAQYCPVGGTTMGSTLDCGSPAVKYNPEIEFCGSDDVVHPTCKPRAVAPLTPTQAYDVDKKVCDSRGNILYDYLNLGGKDWILENAKPNNVNTFSWINAQTACPDSSADGSGPRGWRLADDSDWDGLATAAGQGSAGILLRATSGWTSNSTNVTYSKFAAVPAVATGLSPAPAGNYAYWWTTGECGYVVDGNGQVTGTPVAPGTGCNYNLGNYKYIAEQSTAVGWGHSAKLTTALSARCVRDPLACVVVTPEDAKCVFNGGSPITTGITDVATSCKDLAVFTGNCTLDSGSPIITGGGAADEAGCKALAVFDGSDCTLNGTQKSGFAGDEDDCKDLAVFTGSCAFNSGSGISSPNESACKALAVHTPSVAGHTCP